MNNRDALYRFGLMLHRILSNSRHLILIAVICSFIASITVLLYAAAQTVSAVQHAVMGGWVSSKGGKAIALEFVEIIDLFLIATVF